jgi:uncharacterized protein YfbU (UPF0304 family)
MIPETLSIVERQILANQFRILSKVEGNNDLYETKVNILENGYTEKYHEVFDVNAEEIPFEICEETSQILNMYRRINTAIELLSKEEKEGLDLDNIKFEGFDSNHDSHYHYMTFMIEKMNLWEEYKGNYLNSHCQFQLSKYRKMLGYQNHLLENDQYDLKKEDLEHFIGLFVKVGTKTNLQI